MLVEMRLKGAKFPRTLVYVLDDDFQTGKANSARLQSLQRARQREEVLVRHYG